MAGLPQNIEFMRDELGTLYYLTQLGERINVSLYKPGEVPVIASQDLTGRIRFPNTGIGDQVMASLWASRPPAVELPGATVNITDIPANGSGCEFVSDGINWIPKARTVVLGCKNASMALPFQIIIGSTYFVFDEAKVRIPAGLISPNSTLRVEAIVRRTGVNSAATFGVLLGTGGGGGDAAVGSVSLAATQGICNRVTVDVSFGTNRGLCTSSGVLNSNQSSVSAPFDVDSGINADADMFVNFLVSGANAADSFQLISYRVIVNF